MIPCRITLGKVCGECNQAVRRGIRSSSTYTRILIEEWPVCSLDKKITWGSIGCSHVMIVLCGVSGVGYLGKRNSGELLGAPMSE